MGAAVRSNNFDALRLAAALLVIWGHQYALMGRPVPLILHNEPGALGVVLFFAISGYLVTLSWLADPHIGRFAARRALRIWPGLCVAVALCALVLGPLVTTLPLRGYLHHPATLDYLLNILLQVRFALPGVFDANPLAGSVNGPLWTIALEVGCYVTLAGLGSLGLLRLRPFAPFLFLALAGTLQWRYSPPVGQPMPPWSFPLQYGMIFALGASLACWRDLWESRRWRATGVLLGIFALLHLAGPEPVAGQAPILVLATLGVVGGSASTPVLNKAGSWGDVSYGLYIYAFPVQQLIVWFFSNQLGYAAALGLSLGGALILAGLSWHWVEKPALSFKPGRSTAVRAAAS